MDADGEAAQLLARDAHTLNEDRIFKRISETCGVEILASEGLNEKSADAIGETFGCNTLEEDEGKSYFALIMEQFEDNLVRILLIAAVISLVLAYIEHDEGSEDSLIFVYIEPLVILVILAINAAVGVWQESKATSALGALKRLQAAEAEVLREGEWQTIAAECLVVGDRVKLRVGNKVPADMLITHITTSSLKVEESQLTGESESVLKDEDSRAPLGCEIQAKKNLLFSSTTISHGSVEGIVVGVGEFSEVGAIKRAVEEAGAEEEKTPLGKKIDAFGDQLGKVIAAICIVVWLINWKQFSHPSHGSAIKGALYYFKVAVALAVAAIPEGLPAVINTCLALGTRRMAKRNSIVRKLPSVETLGSTTVICSDKTGTLTTNEMLVTRLSVVKGGTDGVQVYTSALSEDAEGASNYDYRVRSWNIDGEAPIAQAVARIAMNANDCTISFDDEGDRPVRKGEPTEAALLVMAASMTSFDLPVGARRCTLEFTRCRKSMSALVAGTDGKNQLFCKGAPEGVLERCSRVMLADGRVAPMTDAVRRVVHADIEVAARGALRTIGLAHRLQVPGALSTYDGSHHHAGQKLLDDPQKFLKVEQDMVWVGMAGIRDPPRAECHDAIAKCHMAGIAVIMVTGDNRMTAEAIATDLGIIQASQSELSIEGRAFAELSDLEQDEFLMEAIAQQGAVFSRTEPVHKQAIVKRLSQMGEVVAMTGDGVNDAPALKQADIGIAMGISGTEVAKDASDMVLMDDNFATIVAAVEEGRSIYSNMKAFIRYLISSNIGEVASIFITAFLGVPQGLAPVQLLWVNLVTDGPPATALGFNPPDLDVMRRPPRSASESLISGWVFFRYMVIGIYVGFATVGIFVFWFVLDVDATDKHTLVTFEQLRTWPDCTSSWFTGGAPRDLPGMGLSFGSDPCSYFSDGTLKASTLSLTVLVVIEMLNALNALSEDGSLLQMPPWKNLWLCGAVVLSIAIHMIILYVPVAHKVFSVTSLDAHDWYVVMVFSLPVIFIDEVLKLCGRIQLEADVAKLKHE